MAINQLIHSETQSISGGSEFFPGYASGPYITGSVFSYFNQPGLDYRPISWYHPGYTPTPNPSL
jgi:hypothetical protein